MIYDRLARFRFLDVLNAPVMHRRVPIALHGPTAEAGMPLIKAFEFARNVSFIGWFFYDLHEKPFPSPSLCPPS